jgi:hypothetical protein
MVIFFESSEPKNFHPFPLDGKYSVSHPTNPQLPPLSLLLRTMNVYLKEIHEIFEQIQSIFKLQLISVVFRNTIKNLFADTVNVSISVS